MTDNEELVRGIETIPMDASNQTIAYLYYLTQRPLPFIEDGKSLVAHMDPDFAGEIYTDYSLRSFGFSGIPRFGTLSHIVYGIRTFEGIQSDVIGLHAAVVHDEELGGCHLLVGPTKSGKSTLGKELERLDPKRFTLLGDDWAEVKVDGNINVVSPIFSPSTPDPDQQPIFISFNKPYYARPNFGGANYKMRTISVTELHPECGLSADLFVRKSMSAVPFMISDDYDALRVDTLHRGNAHGHLSQLIAYRLQRYKEMYSDLIVRAGLPIVVNDRSKNIKQLTMEIYNQVNYK